MSLFSKLFRQRYKKSYVRVWVEKREKELHYSNELSPQNLFAVMIWGLCSFCKEHTDSNVPSESLLDLSKHYNGDASLFELGCYMFFRLDLWMYNQKLPQRAELSPVFATEFDQLFTKALNSEILNIADERISQYGNLFRRGCEIKEYHFYLSQLILKTKDNQLPQPCNFDKIPLNLDFFDETGMKIRLLNWEQHMLPAQIKSIENFCKLTE